MQKLSERFDPRNPRHVYLMDVATSQPESLVPQEAVVVSGDLNWEGEPLKMGDLRLAATVRFPEDGEWLVNTRWQVEGERAYISNELYLTVTKDSGMIGWPKDYSSGEGGGWQSPSELYPISVTLKPSRLPLLGEPFKLTMSINSIRDLAQAEAYLEFFRMEGTTRVRVPLEDILVEGELTWKGRLEEGVPIQLSGTVIFPQEGDWGIYGWSRSSPASYSGNMQSIFFHVGKEESRFGWSESHKRKYEGPPPPATTPLPKGGK